MYSKLIISFFLLSHVVADFYLQDDIMVKLKKQKDNYKVLFKHSIYFMLCTLVVVIFFGFSLMPCILIITASHFVIDKIKCIIEMGENSPVKMLVTFISDQILHVGIIFLTYPFFNEIDFTQTYKTFLNLILTYYPFLNKLNNLNLWVFVIFALTSYLFTMKGGTILTLLIIKLPNGNNINPKFLDIWTTDVNKSALEPGIQEVTATCQEGLQTTEQKDNYGRIIGLLERLVIVTAILINKYEIIAVVVAVKSIGRFKEIERLVRSKL